MTPHDQNIIVARLRPIWAWLEKLGKVNGMKLSEETKEQIVLERAKVGYKVITEPSFNTEPMGENQFRADSVEEYYHHEAKRIRNKGVKATVGYALNDSVCFVERKMK